MPENKVPSDKRNLFRSRRRSVKKKHKRGIRSDVAGRGYRPTIRPTIRTVSSDEPPHQPYAGNLRFHSSRSGGGKRKRKATRRKRRKHTKKGGMFKYSPSVFSPPRRKTPKRRHPALERSSEKSLPKGSHDGKLIYVDEASRTRKSLHDIKPPY